MPGSKRSDDLPGADPARAQRRRQPPTIDVKPTAATTEPGAEPPVKEPPQHVPPQQEPPRQEPPKQEPPKRSAQLAGRLGHAIPLTFAVVAAMCIALLGWAFWPSAQDNDADQIAALNAQMRELQNRPMPAAAVPEGLMQRLAKVEAAVAVPPPPATDPAILQRLEAAENAVKALTGGGDANTALAARIDALEQAARNAQTEIAKEITKAAHTPDMPARLAIAAATLRSAVVSGEPFADELAAVKALGADAAAVAALEPFAGGGAPNNMTLLRELSPLLASASTATPAAAPKAEGFLERLKDNAAKLVRIRPVSETTGDASAAGIARARDFAAKGDLRAAHAEVRSLPAQSRAPLDSWIARVDARDGARAASRKIAGDAARALAPQAPGTQAAQ